MIKVRIVGKEEQEKKFNGLIVFIDVEESDGKECVKCHDPERSCLTRRFNIERVVRGAVALRKHSSFFFELQRYVREKLGDGQCLCLDCFEKKAEDNLGGFESAD